MNDFVLYKLYSRNEIMKALFGNSALTTYSSKELILNSTYGALLVSIGTPPANTYFVTKDWLVWVSKEPHIDFYNEVVLRFKSRNALYNRLFLFGTANDDNVFIYLGQLYVQRGDGPSKGDDPEFPSTVTIDFRLEPVLKENVWQKFDWKNHDIHINGRILPKALAEKIVDNTWMSPKNNTLMTSILGELSENARFLTPDRMDRSTRQLRHLSELGYSDGYALAQTISEKENFDLLDTSYAICIGDYGPENPFCLDYRKPLTKPRVVYLSYDGRLRWKEIASSIEEFLEKLNIA